MDISADVNWEKWDTPVVFYDGYCYLCDRSVQFIIKHEKSSVLHFAALSSYFALKSNLANPKADSLVFFEQGKYYYKSEAVLRILNYLKWPFSTLTIFKILPKVWRDFVYSWVAINRYTWFGKSAICLVPSPDVLNRFYT